MSSFELNSVFEKADREVLQYLIFKQYYLFKNCTSSLKKLNQSVQAFLEDNSKNDAQTLLAKFIIKFTSFRLIKQKSIESEEECIKDCEDENNLLGKIEDVCSHQEVDIRLQLKTITKLIKKKHISKSEKKELKACLLEVAESLHHCLQRPVIIEIIMSDQSIAPYLIYSSKKKNSEFEKILLGRNIEKVEDSFSENESSSIDESTFSENNESDEVNENEDEDDNEIVINHIKKNSNLKTLNKTISNNKNTLIAPEKTYKKILANVVLNNHPITIVSNNPSVIPLSDTVNIINKTSPDKINPSFKNLTNNIKISEKKSHTHLKDTSSIQKVTSNIDPIQSKESTKIIQTNSTSNPQPSSSLQPSTSKQLSSLNPKSSTFKPPYTTTLITEFSTNPPQQQILPTKPSKKTKSTLSPLNSPSESSPINSPSESSPINSPSESSPLKSPTKPSQINSPLRPAEDKSIKSTLKLTKFFHSKSSNPLLSMNNKNICNSSNAISTTAGRKRLKQDTITGHRGNGESSKNKMVSDIEISDSSLEDIDFDRQKKHPKNFYHSSRKRAWNYMEEMRFVKLVQEYGVGNWADIVNSGKLTGRSNVDLKDKYRNLSRNGRLSEIQENIDLEG